MDGREPLDWESETFAVDGLGAVTVSGTHGNGILTSVPGSCTVAGRPVEVSAECRFPEDGAAEIVSLLAGASPGTGRKLTDGELEGVRDLIEEALSEWWETPEARAMVSANGARDLQRAAGGRHQELRALEARLAECAALLTSSLATADEAAALVREMEEAHRRASALRWALA